MKRLTNREIVKILYDNYIVLDARVAEIGLQDCQKLYLKDGELWRD